MHAADQLGRGRRAADEHAPERREVAAWPVGMVEQHDDLRRDAAQVREALALDRLEDGRGIEGVVHERRAEVRDLEPDARHGADVREGEPGGEVLLTLGHAARVAPPLDLDQREEAPVRVPGALRHPRRAAGEDDGGRVVGGDGGAGGRGRRAEVRDRAGGGRTEPVGGEPDDVAQLGQLRPQRLDDGAEVGVVPAVDGEEAARARTREHVADLRPPVADVDAGGDRAEPRRPEIGDEVERRGRQQERHDVAPPHAARGERAGGPLGERIPVGVGQALAAVAEGLGVGRAACGLAQQLGQGGRGHERSPASRRSSPRSAFISSKRSMRADTAALAPSRASVAYSSRSACAAASSPATGQTTIR